MFHGIANVMLKFVKGEKTRSRYIGKPSDEFEIDRPLLEAMAGFPVENMNFFR